VHSCVTLYYTGKALVCQYQVAAQADEGDSGSPTFWWMSPGVNQAWLGGLLHHNIPGYYYTFSSITGIKNDFANLVTH
jgi:hypothetical protein